MSALSSPEPRQRPRREAGTKAEGDPEPRKIVFSLTIDGQDIRVDYVPYWSSGEFPYGHFEFRSPHEPPRRIPVSETGYRSHFAPMGEIEAAPSPEAYAREVALALLRGEGGQPPDEEDSDRLSLFPEV